MVFDKAKLRSAIKKKDGWWASIFSGPLANRFLEPICEIEWITPNLITITSLFIGLIASWFFFRASHLDLIIGAVLVQLSFIVDCMDGQLARYRQQFSTLGAWLDRISDRVKDFFYFFSLALGFFLTHRDVFQLGLTGLADFTSRFINDDFLLPQKLQLFMMKSIELPSWIIFPVTMIAMFSVFLIDYYVNQDMKLEAPMEPVKGEGVKGEKNNSTFLPFYLFTSLPSQILKSILKFGLSVYESIPLLRFNIGEQALLLSLFTAFDAVFTGMSFFALLGSFYCLIWPLMKLKGYSPEK